MAVDKMPRQEEPSSTAKWEPLALAAAILTLVGSLYLSMGMGLVACPLCFYQRTFIMGVVGVLGVGMALRLPLAPGTLSLLALPLAVAGLGVALIHSNLVWTEVLACPLGIFALGSAPFQSLIAYAVVTALLLPHGVDTPCITGGSITAPRWKHRSSHEPTRGARSERPRHRAS
jgi:disulfide bond formation protein DsbB